MQVSTIRFWLAGLAVAGSLGTAQAQTVRFIAVNGKDANSCTIAAPCRTLQRGVDATPAGGEVKALNAGPYGGAAINRSITVSADHASATFRTISIGNSGARVVLRGLLLDGNGAAATGIAILDAASVHIKDCRIERFTENGIHLDVANTELFIADTASRENGRSGLLVRGQSANEQVTVTNSRFDNNSTAGINLEYASASISGSVVSGNGAGTSGSGILVYGAGTTNVIGTTAAHNGGFGFRVLQGALATFEASTATGNGYGLYVVSAVGRVSNSVLTNNNTGIQNDSGTIETRQNNLVSGNAVDTGGALTAIGGT
jgi:hypothetical protein